MTKPTRHPTTTDVLIKNRADTLKTKGLNRHRIIPRVVQPPSSSGRKAVSGQEAGNSGLALKTAGDTMVGPIAFNPKIALIDSTDPLNPEIDISEEEDQAYTSYIYVGFSSPSEIRTILGASFDGQWLILQSTDPVGLTLRNGSEADGGNIITETGADITLGLGEIAQLIFDPTGVADPGVNGAWRVMSGGGATSGSGGNAKTGSMATTKDNTQSVATATQVTLDVFDLVRIEDGVTVNTTTNILTIQETGRYLFGASINVFTDRVNTNVNFQLFVNGIGVPDATSLFIRGTFDSDSLYPTVPLDLTIADEVEIRISHDETVTVIFTFEECIFYLIKQESAGSGGGYETILDEGVSLPQQSTFNFIGSAVNAVDNPGQSRTDVTITAGGTSLPVIDTTPIVFGSGDPTKQLRFEIDGFTTATTRVMTIPDASTTLSGLSLTQTWTGTNTFTGSTFNVQTSAINLGDAISDSINFLGRSGTNLIPISNSDKNLGASGLQWNTLWIDTLDNASSVVINSPNFSINSSQITLGDAITDEVSFLGRVGDLGIIPINNSAANLGANGNQWNTLWIDTLQNASTVVINSPNFAINSSQITLGDAITDEVSFLGRVGNLGILPINNSAANLGGSGNQWNTLWIDTLTNASAVTFTSPITNLNSAQTRLGDASSDNLQFLGQVSTNIVIEEITEPGNAPANTGRFYAKVDGGVSVPFWKDEGGTESSMIGGGAASLVGVQDNEIWQLQDTTQFEHDVYMTNSKSGTTANGGTGAGLTQDVGFWVPIFLAKRSRIIRMGLEITGGTSSNSNVVMGIYSNRTDGQNYPETLQVQGNTFLSNTASAQTVFVSATNLEAGLYWLVVSSTSGNLDCIFTLEGESNCVGYQLDTSGTDHFNAILGYLSSQTTTTLPGTAPDDMPIANTAGFGAPMLFAIFNANTA